MPITLRLSAYKSHWIVGEPLGFNLVLQNHSRKTVHVPDLNSARNWQPDYTIHGPGYAKPVHFNTGFPRFLPEPADRKFRDLDLVAIKPGQALEGQIEVRADVSRPGDYTVSASVQTSLGVVEGGPLTLTVSAATQPTQAALMPSGSGAPTACWIVSGPHGAQVQRNPFDHKSDDDGRRYFVLDGGALVANVRPDAREPFLTETDIVDADVSDWTGWRDGAALYAIQGFVSTHDPVLRFPLPGDSHLVPHALMSADQALDVFVLSADGRTLQMARFLSPFEQYMRHRPQPPPRLAWSHPLPAPAEGAAAALAPAHAGSARHVVWTSQRGDALLVGHVVAPADGRPPADAPPVALPQAHALPGCRPAVRVDAAGVTHVAVLYAGDAGLRQISLAELTFGAGGQPTGAPGITAQGALPEAAVAGAISYGKDTRGEFRRDWLVTLGDGRVVFRIAGRAAHGPLPLGASPASPLALASLDAGTFVLTLDPKTGAGPNLTRLRE